ncbi:AraC family transcriptional regulator [Pseudoclavibacter chungangensis]|uniref:HTH-type transcriptional regulator RipA n=1 Tax=Pseudoclavibacter chungangensis TaxID=587635 RepID=A0A7J5BP45_9MICO|nr:AraC family transcriptional regulator [Pseudoclavibacter chungangensis]KAB1654285.1 AraC family transcriptional regulator [Pseudoclavibacter chungangensis]NYJ65309.1 AraC-like DNA-binding protein/mannose-6-phosphate isomerase-like protein (cupin superfamily) [Pseudoclavibacter chungangensis]
MSVEQGRLLDSVDVDPRTVDEQTFDDVLSDLSSMPAGSFFATHFHEHDQLAWVSSGSGRLGVRDETWLLDRDCIVWIPAGTLHDMTFPTRSVLVSVYLPTALRPAARRWGAPRAVETEPLLTAIMSHLAEGPRELERIRLGHGLLVHLLDGAVDRPFVSAVPNDPRIAVIARALLDDPADTRELGDWAALQSVSTKTLERLFARETGTTFRRWRARARLHAAADLLVRGERVALVAQRVGYLRTSSFVAAFAERFGTTPGRFAAQAHGRRTDLADDEAASPAA